MLWFVGLLLNGVTYPCNVLHAVGHVPDLYPAVGRASKQGLGVVRVCDHLLVSVTQVLASLAQQTTQQPAMGRYRSTIDRCVVCVGEGV
jgi:hypothetical protein